MSLKNANKTEGKKGKYILIVPKIEEKKSLSIRDTYVSNFAKLVLGLGCGNPVDSESAFSVVDDSEVLASLLDLDNVHESSWVLMVGSDPTVNLNVTVLKDVLYLLQSHGVPQTVPKIFLSSVQKLSKISFLKINIIYWLKMQEKV